jgi:hypothetical protein
VRQRRFETLRLNGEHVVEFPYRPSRCGREYRMVAVRKNITVTRGEQALFDEIRYHFYVTNDWQMAPEEVVHDQAWPT